MKVKFIIAFLLQKLCDEKKKYSLSTLIVLIPNTSVYPMLETNSWKLNINWNY